MCICMYLLHTEYIITVSLSNDATNIHESYAYIKKLENHPYSSCFKRILGPKQVKIPKNMGKKKLWKRPKHRLVKTR